MNFSSLAKSRSKHCLSLVYRNIIKGNNNPTAFFGRINGKDQNGQQKSRERRSWKNVAWVKIKGAPGVFRIDWLCLLAQNSWTLKRNLECFSSWQTEFFSG